MFRKVLIANRGEIAVRIQRTLRKLGVESVAIYSDADRESRHVLDADHAIALGGRTAAESYLNAEAVLAGARSAANDSGLIGIHPGYGFLSENAAFAEACARQGFVFIGPTPDQLREFGLKHTARELAEKSAVPLLPGSALLADFSAARAAAERIGYPVMLKSTAGGGGIGMRLCANALELEREFQTVRDLGRRNFADDGLYVEKFVERARHVEIQIFGDGQGRVLALGERDCSVQRRNQKVIEETPAPGLPESLRTQLCAAAVRLGESVRYRSAGTVEFVYDEAAGACYFLEVNTRLQVEHGITENVRGLDLVEWMIRLAAGDTGFWPAPQAVQTSGAPVGPDPARRHSIQVRIYAEDPAKNFQPGSGILNHVAFPDASPELRVDTYIESGTIVSPYYDPLLAKLMVTAATRQEMIEKLGAALRATQIYGIQTNLEFLQAIIAGEDFRAGRLHTRMLNEFSYVARTIDVLQPGAQTTVQDLPGRLGYWSVGVPPSGPMDALSFSLGNRLLENSADAAGLEMTVTGATLRFHTPTVICLAGALMHAHLILSESEKSIPVPFWQAVAVPAGAVLKIGALVGRTSGSGQRSYLLVKGGLDVPPYLGSRSTFTLGEFGGHAGRSLAIGDVLRITECDARTLRELDGRSIAFAQRPVFAAEILDSPNAQVDTIRETQTAVWRIGVLDGPHGAPEFFTPEDIDTIFQTDYEVHYNSARTGVRLIGPRPCWARADGGEAGLHPSNIHDNAYAFGTLDFTGDMPIILGPDGPSLGGFVCPVTIIAAELWKVGQLRPGDRVRFVRANGTAESAILSRQMPGTAVLSNAAGEKFPTTDVKDITVVVRQAGDRFVLIEYGPPVLDINLRFRVHALMRWLQDPEHDALAGIVDLTPGIRSLQIQYDPVRVSRAELLRRIEIAEAELAGRPTQDAAIATRIVYLPLAWNDPSTRLATEKYMQSVWKDAPWCPDNLEFIRRINGLENIEDVRKVVFDASYLVMGLGDVYLGAPVATPLDPRHRLVTTKYNPARTWTPQNAVGIGGAYLCIYGMEGPGGYQFVGRTCQVWNTYRQTAEFLPDHPYLLRFFDELRFYPVSPEELLDFRADFLTGRVGLRVEPHRFSPLEYNRFLKDNAQQITAFKARQQAAFEAERERWRGLPPPIAVENESRQAATDTANELPEHAVEIASPMHGNVWKILVAPGARVSAGDDVLVLEAMKMEVAVQATADGIVNEVLCEVGSAAAPGQRLLIIDTRESGATGA